MNRRPPRPTAIRALAARMLGPGLALLLGPAAAWAQVPAGDLGPVRVEPPASKDEGRHPLLFPDGVGNEVYRVHVDGTGESACGAWTATTGTLHEAGPGRNVLYGSGNPGTSDSTLWSWTTNTGYRTGGNGGGCETLCSVDSPTATALFHGAQQTGWRLTWRFADGANTIELVQEVEVEGPVDGSQTVDNSAIRETHVVRNLGPGTFRFGLRKHWDWQIDGDDGPWFATCDHPDDACDRSMNFHADGGGVGVYPPNYVINEDPLDSWCPDGVAPNAPSACTGRPIYIVAGTVSPPSGLVPPPDPPEMLSFNSWTRLINQCWNPLLDDAALCGARGSPSDDTAIAYFYGLTSATAEVLAPGEEKSFTQYVVAAEDGCPVVLEDPTVECDAGGPYEQPCTGPVAHVQMNGTATVSEGSPIISWTHDCAGGSFDDPTAEDPVLTLDVAGCTAGCGVTMTVASSAGGETRTCTSFVAIRDDQAPAIACPPPLTVPCLDGGARRVDPAIDAWLRSAVASDACGSVNVTNDMPSFVAAAGCVTQRTITWTASDACGHVAQCTSTLRIEDQLPPVVTPPADVQRDCGDPPGDQAAWRATATATDDCAGALPVASSLITTTSPCPGTTVETWQFAATDACGRTATATATWTVGDATPPVVTPPGPAEIECGPGAAAAEQAWLEAASALDACQGARPVVRLLVQSVPGCAGEETRTWRFSADDGCGNLAEVTADLVVRDRVPPSIAGVPGDATVACGAVPPPAAVTASDACDPGPQVTLSESTAPGRCPQELTLTRTWTATDACGNSASRSQAITIVDTIAPSIAGVPADATVECSAVPAPAPVTASDACDPAPALAFAETSVPGACPQSRTITRTWTATDACGNSASRSQRLTVVDTVAPSLSGVPADATVECSAVPAPAPVTASDACDAAPGVVFAETSVAGPCPQSRTITRTWTATDACGNSASRSQRLTVVDTVAPSLSGVPADATVECTAVPSPPPVTASDACDAAPALAFAETIAAGPCPQSRTVTRTWTATDACGNAASRSQRLTVVDTVAPSLSGVPPDATVACDAVPAPAAVAASDACDPVPVVTFAETSTPGPCPLARTITRTWTARDACGNSESRSQRLTVTDTTPPVLSGVPGDVTVSCAAVPPPATVTATDACDPAPSLVFAQTRTDDPTCPDRYVLVRIWTSTDSCGNVAQGLQHVTVTDTAAPVIAGVPADATVSCDAVPSAPSLTATDDCSPSQLVVPSETSVPGACPNERTLTRTWTASDRCGNTTVRSQVLQVVDTTPPALAAPPDALVECPAPASGPGSEAAWIASASATDTCGPASVQSVELQRVPGCGATIRVVREFWALDACGLQSPHVTREWVVQDTTPPALVAPPDAVVECPAPAAGPGSEAAWIASASASDGCGAAIVQGAELQRVPGCGGTVHVVREFWAVDACGLQSPHVTRTWDVVDTTPPVLAAPPDAVVECPAPAAGAGSEAAWIASASASDACGPASVQSRELSRVIGCGATFVVTREFWAVDACGLESARAIREYRVVDTTPPAFAIAGGAPQFEVSLWPPNHGYVVFRTADVASATDLCGATSLRATGCASDQPEDVHQGLADDGANGDGRFAEDCVIALDGSAFAVRAERLGACGKDSRRTYVLELTATDECGNASRAEGRAVVEHDRSGHGEIVRGDRLPPNAPPPFPWFHPTVYGPGCGSTR